MFKKGKIQLSIFSAISISLFFSTSFLFPQFYKNSVKDGVIEKSDKNTGTELWGTGGEIELYSSGLYDAKLSGIIPEIFGYEGEKTAYSQYLNTSSPYGHDSSFRLNYNGNGNPSSEIDRYGAIVGGIDYYDSFNSYQDNNIDDGIANYFVSQYGPGYNLASNQNASSSSEIFTIKLPDYISSYSLIDLSFKYFDNYLDTSYNFIYPYTTQEVTIKNLNETYIVPEVISKSNGSNAIYAYNDFWLTYSSNQELTLNNRKEFSNSFWENDDDIIQLNSLKTNIYLNFTDIDLSGFNANQNPNPEITIFDENTAQIVFTLSSPIDLNGRGDELSTNDYDDNGLIIVDQFGNTYPFTTNGNQLIISGLTSETTYNMKFMQYKNPMDLENIPLNLDYYEIVPNTSEFVIEIGEYVTETVDPFGGITGSNFGIEMIDQTSTSFQLRSRDGLTFQSGDQIILSDDTNGLNYTITFNDPLDYTDVTLSSPNISWSYSGGPTNPEMSITVSGLNPNSSYEFDIETHTGINDIVKINTYSFYTDYEDIDNTASAPISASTTSTTESSISGTYIIDLKGRNYDDYSNLVLLDQANNEIIFPNDKFTLTNPTTNTYNYEITNLNSNYQVTQISLTYRENRDETITDSSIYTQTINISLDDGAYTIFERPTLEYSQIDFSSTSSIYEAYFEIKDYGSFGKSLDIQGEIITKIDLFENIRFEKYQDDVWTEIDLTGSEVIAIDYYENFNSYYIAFDRNQLGMDVTKIRVFLPYYDRSISGGEYNYDYNNPDYIFDFANIANINPSKTTVEYSTESNLTQITLNGNLRGYVGAEDFFFTYTTYDGINESGKTNTMYYKTENNMFVQTEIQPDSTINYIYNIYDLPPGKEVVIEEYGFKNFSGSVTFDEFATSSTVYTNYKGLSGITENNFKLTTINSNSFSFKLVLTNQQLVSSNFDGTQIRIKDEYGDVCYPLQEIVTFEIVQDQNNTIFYYTIYNLEPNTDYGSISIDIADSFSGSPTKDGGQFIYGESFGIGNVTTLSQTVYGISLTILITLILIIVLIFLTIIFATFIYFDKKHKKIKKLHFEALNNFDEFDSNFI